MPFYAKAASFLLLALGGCHGNDPAHFLISNASIVPVQRAVTTQLSQVLELSAEAREALENGVPLNIMIELELREPGSLIRVAAETYVVEIRYLPLSEHYQLTGPENMAPRTFPRLRHALAELGSLRLRLDTPPLRAGEYEMRARLALDIQRLPAPMRLPAWLSVSWRHDSERTTWPFDVSA